jgi:hypothetical protein
VVLGLGVWIKKRKNSVVFICLFEINSLSLYYKRKIDMRIEIDKLVEIQNIVDCQVEIGGIDRDSISLRFGYWNRLTDSDLEKVKEILGYRSIECQLVDEDEDCGELWNYKVWYNPFK